MDEPYYTATVDEDGGYDLRQNGQVIGHISMYHHADTLINELRALARLREIMGEEPWKVGYAAGFNAAKALLSPPEDKAKP